MVRRLRTRLELLRPDLSARIEQKSRRINPMVQRGFEVGEPVMAKDYRNRGSAWTKGFVQDRLGPVTYMQVCLFQRKTHSLNNSLYRMRSLPHPWLKFHLLDRLFHKKKMLRILLSQSFPKNLAVVQLEFDRNLNV